MIIVDYIKAMFALKELDTSFGHLMNWVLMIGISALSVLAVLATVKLWKPVILPLLTGLGKLALAAIGSTSKGAAR